jgi:hypothetical protein
MKNTLIVSIIFIAFSACTKSKDSENQISGCTNPGSFNFSPLAVKDDGSCREMAGCLGYATGFSNSGNISNTLGDPYWDQKMAGEVSIQRNFFNGVSANVYILYEPSASQRNAYATPDGNILFGYYMHYYTIQTFGELPVAGVLAHEWGHRVQYTYGWNAQMQNPHIELEADAFSGYYMVMAKSFAWSQIQGYYSNVYATGDYMFNSPTHHGTPDQRLAAAYLGVQTAVDALNNNKHYSYQQLHATFLDAINNSIVGKRDLSDTLTGKKEGADIYVQIVAGKSKGQEYALTRAISNPDRQSLFPKQ